MAKLEVAVEVEVAGVDDLDKISDSFSGVSDDLSTTADDLGDVGEELDQAADASRTMASELDQAADSAEATSSSVGSLTSTFDGLGDAVGGSVEALGGIGDIIEGDLTGIADLVGGLGELGSGVIEGVVPAFQAVKAGAIGAAADMASSVGKQVTAWAMLGVQSLIHAGKVALAWVIATGPVGVAVAAIVAAAALIILNWEKVVAFFQKVWQDIVVGFKILSTSLGKIWDHLSEMASEAWNGLVNVIKGAINIVIGAINAFIGFINGIQIHIPEIGVGPVHTPAFDWWGLGIPKIPYLAEGGIIDSPTLAMLGERSRPEAVIPLDRLGAMGNTYNIYLTVEGDLTAKTPEEVVEVLQRAARFTFDTRLATG